MTDIAALDAQRGCVVCHEDQHMRRGVCSACAVKAYFPLVQRVQDLEQENTQLRDAAQRMVDASPSTYQDEMMALEEALAALDAATEAEQ